MTLDQIKPGSGGVIQAVGGEGALRRHLLDMGLTPGTKIQVRRVAPMGDPIELVLRGYVLTIRLDDAAKIVLREAPPEPSSENGSSGSKGTGFHRLKDIRGERGSLHALFVGTGRQSEQRKDDPV